MYYKIIGLRSIPGELLEVGEKKYYKKNDILLDGNEIPQGILILLKGTVLTVKESSDGNINILQIFEPLIPLFDKILFSDVNNKKKIISENTAPNKFICYSDVEVIYINKLEFINLIKNNSNINNFFLETAYYRMSFLISQNKFNLFNGEQRIYNIFLEFALYYGIEINHKIKINFKLSQQFISSLADVNRSTTVRAINKLKELNILEYKNGYYYIPKIHLLEDICSSL